MQTGKKGTDPVFKWAGGKRGLAKTLLSFLPEKISVWCEPFFGGGALLFRLCPPKAIINDINADLMNAYAVIKDDVDTLIDELKKYHNTPDFFYAIRALDRDKACYQELSAVQKAARLLYLNKTCYNGLYRVNAAGQFNVPFGQYKNPNIVNEDGLRAVSSYLNTADVRLFATDYAAVLDDLDPDAFVYFDPPYDPVSATSNFTSYSKEGFSRDEQIRLRCCCDDLDKRGIRFMLSNALTPFIKEQYAAYSLTVVRAKRAISANGEKRGHVDEVVVRNYE